VQISDEIWMSFRVGLAGTPVNIALGELVTRAVGRQQRRDASDDDGLHLALEDARALAGELKDLIARLEAASGARATPTPSDRPVEAGTPIADGPQTRLQGV
jgi:hypothetical protein